MHFIKTLISPVLDEAASLAHPRVLAGAAARLQRLLRDRAPEPAPSPAPAASSPAGQFLARQYDAGAAGRDYKLFVPGGLTGRRVPLVVMLHGCLQNPDSFAAGTRMNVLAEVRGFLVAYPAQSGRANAQKCWNWFNPADQARDAGEPALIAGITRQIMAEYTVDPARVYVAGLSAGGAAASVMGATYPDLFAAIGVHSGVACGVARDVGSALAAMRQGGVAAPGAGPRVPAIVFHADRDTTVHPRNGDQMVAQMVGGQGAVATETGQVPGGHSWTRSIYRAAGGAAVEQWVVHGGGHAWSGGSKAGSFTDPLGPDASREMLRFFLDHPRPG